MGVWIETNLSGQLDKSDAVTPYVGVWIETLTGPAPTGRAIVTPYVGVWIETEIVVSELLTNNGHSLCGSVD